MPIVLQTGEGRCAENISESGKGKDFHNDRGQQEYYRAVDEARQDKRGEARRGSNWTNLTLGFCRGLSTPYIRKGESY